MYAHSEFPPFHRVFCTSSDSPNKQPEYPAYDHIAVSYTHLRYIVQKTDFPTPKQIFYITPQEHFIYKLIAKKVFGH